MRAWKDPTSQKARLGIAPHVKRLLEANILTSTPVGLEYAFPGCISQGLQITGQPKISVR